MNSKDEIAAKVNERDREEFLAQVKQHGLSGRDAMSEDFITGDTV
jgi:hypothetical protein